MDGRVGITCSPVSVHRLSWIEVKSTQVRVGDPLKTQWSLVKTPLWAALDVRRILLFFSTKKRYGFFKLNPYNSTKYSSYYTTSIRLLPHHTRTAYAPPEVIKVEDDLARIRIEDFDIVFKKYWDKLVPASLERERAHTR